MTAISAASATESHETANPFPDVPAIRGSDPSPLPARPRGPAPRSYPRPGFGDYSRTRFESRVAFGGPDEGEGEDAEETIARSSNVSGSTCPWALGEETISASSLPDFPNESSVVRLWHVGAQA